MKLLFYIPGLVDGGAERVIAAIASHFAQRDHSVTLAVDFKVDQNRPPLDPAVDLVVLSKGHGTSIHRLAKLLVITRPDIALSAIASNNVKLVAASLLARLYGLNRRERKPRKLNLVLTYHGFEEYKSGWMSWLGTVTLPVISRISARTIAVSDALRVELADRWKAKSENLLRIHNPVEIPDPSKDHSASRTSEMPHLVVSAGRLVPGKRFDLLIEAFAKTSDPTAKLIILGEGPERQNLQNLIKKHALQNRVELPGFSDQPGRTYEKAACFVLTSQRESFGLVLVEALAYGLRVISTDSGGPREILDNGRFGVLLGKDPTPLELAKAIDEALENPGDPLPRIERARAFDSQTGLQQYADLFAQIIKENA